MILILDTRERALIAECASQGIAHKVATLDVGDIMIQNDEGEPLLVAERKTHADFASSLMDGRYKEQRARLMATRGQGIAVLYILEGTWSDAVDRMFHRVSEIQLQRLTTRLVLRYGMPLLHVASLKATAQWCQRLLEQLTDEPEVFHPQKGLAAETTGALATYATTFSTVKKANRGEGGVAIGMLSAIPGLGGKRVTGLLEQKSIADLVTMSAADIAGLTVGKKLGEKIGQAVFDALHFRSVYVENGHNSGNV
jgi:hypothetical protein